MNLIVKEKDIPGYGGRIYNNRIAIHKGLPSQTEKACILAEELGHYQTTVGNILDQTDVSNRKQERRARIWAYRKAFDLSDLIQAFKAGCRNRYEIAEHLGITEQFLQDAVDCFKEKYGPYVTYCHYILYLEPLGVLEMV